MHVEKNCMACGDLIRVRLADHKRGWGKFCDKACAAAYKTGQRPRDVNAGHAKYSMWAADRMRHFAEHGQPVKARPIKKQLGKNVKVKPIYHSPCQCRRCGEPVNGPGLCDACWAHEDGLHDQSWDAHSVG
jgi:hypothetical protein